MDMDIFLKLRVSVRSYSHDYWKFTDAVGLITNNLKRKTDGPLVLIYRICFKYILLPKHQKKVWKVAIEKDLHGFDKWTLLSWENAHYLCNWHLLLPFKAKHAWKMGWTGNLFSVSCMECFDYIDLEIIKIKTFLSL